MKQNHTDLVVIILWSVVGVILTGMIIVYIVNFVNNIKPATNHILKTAEESANGYIDSDITMYDTEDVRGSEVINFVKKHLGDYSASETAPIYAQVITITSGSTYTNQYVNNTHNADIKNFTSAQYYITPTAMFHCVVVKTANQAILGVKFTQK